MNDAQGKMPRMGKIIRRSFRLIEHVLATFAALLLLFWLCFNYSRVLSPSMSPTLQGSLSNYDSVLTEKISYWFRQPRRFEVVAFYDEEGTQVMKRVVGLPGEKVQMLRHGRLFIDGKELSPPAELCFLHYFPYGNLSDDQAVDCGQGYYLLGDFSRDSGDSRFSGPIDPKKIIGRAWLVVRPSERMGVIH
jgi:signal peptidase I